MSADSILVQIRHGEYDEMLDDIIQYCSVRKKALGTVRFSQIKIGSTVRFISTIRPTYLRGMTAKVVGKKMTKLVVQLERPVGRFHGDIRVPATLVEEVDEN